jgi:hypothetical protein
MDLSRDLVGQVPERKGRIQADSPSRAASADCDQIQVRCSFGICQAIETARNLDQKAFVAQSVQVTPMNTRFYRILGPENTPGA